MKNCSLRARRSAPVLFAPALSLLSLATSAVLAQTTAGEIVVTASRTEQILTDVLPHTTVLGRDAIEQSQVLDLPTLLSREAGFQFTQNGGPGTSANLFLRGSASLQVLVLIDHVRDAQGNLFEGGAAFARLWLELRGWRLAGRVFSVWPFSWAINVGYKMFLPIRPTVQKYLLKWDARHS